MADDAVLDVLSPEIAMAAATKILNAGQDSAQADTGDDVTITFTQAEILSFGWYLLRRLHDEAKRRERR